MPSQPFLHIILTLDVPVALAHGTLGAGYGKQEAAEQGTEDKSGHAQSESETPMDFVTIDGICAEPCSNADHNGYD